MIRNNLRWLLLVGVLAVSPYSQGIAHPHGVALAPEARVIAIQGAPGWPGGPGWGQDRERREHCWRLHNRAREIQDRIYSAPPWERGGMERHLWEVRERIRGECPGMWRQGQ